MILHPRHGVWLVALSAIAAAGCSQDVLKALSTKTDEFTQNAASKIDVLWVVDNSGSMAEEQAALGQNFSAFINTLESSDIDYHIGVVDTDTGDGGQLQDGTLTGNPTGDFFITNATANAATVFLNNVKVGTNGSPQEKGFESAALALGEGIGWTSGTPPNLPSNNTGFLRSDAALYIIMVSDEDDQSFGPVRYYQRLFESYKGPGNEPLVTVSAIVGPPGKNGGCNSPGRGSASPGDRYVDLAGQTNGTWTSICGDFKAALTELSNSAAGLKQTFVLSSAPNTSATVKCDQVAAGAFCVRVDGTAVAPGGSRTGWLYDSDKNAIVFGIDSIPKPQSKITVEYQEVAQ